MKLYHSRSRFAAITLNQIKIPLTLILFVLLNACGTPQVKSGELTVRIQADGGERQIQIAAGNTVQDALAAAGTEPGELDRIEPAAFTVLTEDTLVRLVRVREEFVIEQVIVPYEEKLLRNESLPEGKEYALQAGQNGLKDVTTRRVFEDGVEVSSNLVKSLVMKESLPQIKMVGVQKPFSPLPIPGRLVYLTGGDAWMIEGTTGTRVPVATTGDLDGRVFDLSPDGKWLLYTRRSQSDGVINTLWAARLDDPAGAGELKVDLKVTNVIHFAGWRSGSTYTIAYSTVEPRAAAPGWQANNDLSMLSLNLTGQIRPLPPELETNMGGNYGWWGMTFGWSTDGKSLAFARPDSIGQYLPGTGMLSPVLDIIPLQTRSDWAWVPGISWGPDGKIIYTVTHAPSPGTGSPEESPLFDLTAISLVGGAPVNLVTQAGMFAYPLASPTQILETGESSYSIAYLQANNPKQSEGSRYSVMLLDRDGSNRRRLFPMEGSPGFEPQAHWGVWSSSQMKESGGYAMALIYQDNLWIVDASSGEAWQVTGDNSLSRVDWK